LTLALYQRARDVALDRGLILADTKFEFGYGAEDDDHGIGVPAESDVGLVLGDEVLTPDSSRFWPADKWKPGRAQLSFDKQFVRDWLTSGDSGWERDGETPPPPLPESIVEQTRAKYIEAYRLLTGLDWS
jgi:phosphoribosylaminoimidazole-succinocarboxamide synthase